ncbi:ABC transporter substrate-binding protein [Streptomyces sp. NPDC002454]
MTAASVRFRRTSALVLASALLAGCGTGAPERRGGRDAPSAPGFPVTLDNCGVRTTYERPPERVVTIHQHPTEVMLALGLGDRLVGTAFPDSAPLPGHAREFRGLPVLSEREPSFETVLAAEPDFVYGGFDSAFAAQEGRSREAFAEAGIDTRLNLEYCGRGRTSMSDAYAEIRAVGSVFGVRERADRLVAELRRRVEDAHRAVRGARAVPVLVYDSGQKTAYTAGGRSLATDVIALAGGRNVFADLDEVFGDVSWEQVAERRPEAIVIHDYEGGGSLERKKEFLRSHPALAEVPAVREERFVTLPLAATLVGVRPPHAVAELARGLHPERFR